MKLYYRITGKGPALFILHGLYGSSDNWYSISAALSDKFTVVTPDLRNHGKSPHNKIHTYNEMATDIYELVKEMDLNRIYIAGHSMGGKVAMLFAIKWPETVNGLTVLDISPFAKTDTKNAIFDQHRRIISSLLSEDPCLAKTREEVQTRIAEKTGSDKIAGFLMKNLTRLDNGSFAWKLNIKSIYNNIDNIMGGIIEYDQEPVSGFPVTFVRGSKSDYISGDEIPPIRKVFPAAEFVTIAEAGHWLHSDKPEEVIRILREMAV
jgi:pimeloyl-ACP methyl ester carboxylesterase